MVTSILTASANSGIGSGNLYSAALTIRVLGFLLEEEGFKEYLNEVFLWRLNCFEELEHIIGIETWFFKEDENENVEGFIKENAEAMFLSLCIIQNPETFLLYPMIFFYEVK